MAFKTHSIDLFDLIVCQFSLQAATILLRLLELSDTYHQRDTLAEDGAGGLYTYAKVLLYAFAHQTARNNIFPHS